jgi:catechol 2,3-dioxygenase-like lactoylglutathione lyase family enzyme
MDHVGVVVDDLPAAIAFFTTLGMLDSFGRNAPLRR